MWIVVSGVDRNVGGWIVEYAGGWRCGQGVDGVNSGVGSVLRSGQWSGEWFEELTVEWTVVLTSRQRSGQ